MTSKQEYWFGDQRLPAPPSGKAWGILAYPGGRTELHLCDASLPIPVAMAMDKLKRGQRATVPLAQAEILLLWLTARNVAQQEPSHQ